MLIRNSNLHIRRFEFKYLVDESRLDRIRKALGNFMIPDPGAKSQNGRYIVTSVYFDDQNLNSYQEKLAGIKLRKKLRIRTYDKKVSGSSLIFLEIKRRNEIIIFKDRSPLKKS